MLVRFKFTNGDYQIKEFPLPDVSRLTADEVADVVETFVSNELNSDKPFVRFGQDLYSKSLLQEITLDYIPKNKNKEASNARV
jgi:hypothetical protein